MVQAGLADCKIQFWDQTSFIKEEEAFAACNSNPVALVEQLLVGILVVGEKNSRYELNRGRRKQVTSNLPRVQENVSFSYHTQQDPSLAQLEAFMLCLNLTSFQTLNLLIHKMKKKTPNQVRVLAEATFLMYVLHLELPEMPLLVK